MAGPTVDDIKGLPENLKISHQMDRYHRQLGPYNRRNASHSEYTMYRGSGTLYGYYFIARGGQQRFYLNEAYNTSWTSTTGSYDNRLPYCDFWTNWAETGLHWLPKPWHFENGLRMTWDSGNMFLVCFYTEDVPYSA